MNKASTTLNSDDADQDLDISESSLNNSSSKQDLLANKQDLLSLKEEFKKLKKSLIEPDPSSTVSDDFQDFESYESQQNKNNEGESVQSEGCKPSVIPHSTTCDSISEGQGKGYTPSMTSSGYGSQAVSTLTLSSEDSLSLRSNEDSEMVRAAKKAALEHCSSGESDGDGELGQGHNSAILSDTEVKDVTMETVNSEEKIGHSVSEKTLENLDLDKARISEDDRLTIVDDMENTSFTEDSVVEEGVKLHISEEDISSLGSKCINTDENNQSHLQSSSHNNSKPNDTDDGVFESEHKTVSTGDESLNVNDGDDTEQSHLRGSDSSSNTSRGMIHSESIDPYSLEAMEELEKLGEDCDNSDFVSLNETGDSAINEERDNSVSGETKAVDTSLDKNEFKLTPDHQSTPKGAVKRQVQSEGRQRPVSCIVTSENNFLDTSLPGRHKRSSLDLSDEHIAGKYSELIHLL